jgi:hypothetical protein
VKQLLGREKISTKISPDFSALKDFLLSK